MVYLTHYLCLCYRCAVWVSKIGCKHLNGIEPAVLHKEYRLCGKHFDNSMHCIVFHKELKSNAIPTIFEGSGTKVINCSYNNS